MKQYATNEAFRKVFLMEDCTQVEMGSKIDLDKHSVHDWLKNKNQLKFNKLEDVCERLGYKVSIKIDKL